MDRKMAEQRGQTIRELLDALNKKTSEARDS